MGTGLLMCQGLGGIVEFIYVLPAVFKMMAYITTYFY